MPRCSVTHTTPEVQAWLAFPGLRPFRAETIPRIVSKTPFTPRFKLHFTPTSVYWLNLVERFFAEIASKRIRRGSDCSVGDLQAAIYDYLLQHNTRPKPFT